MHWAVAGAAWCDSGCVGVAGDGRIGEALGLEGSSHCFDFENGKLHVVQQLCYNRAKFGGFFLKEPKQGSSGTIDFDTGAMVAVQNHIDKYGYTEIELVDAVDPRHTQAREDAKLIIADGRIPFHDSRRPEVWIPWRRAAGWPEAGDAFHALRHSCAVMLLLSGVDPQYVQNHLRHKMLQTTLAIYSHWLPRNERPRNIISSVLGHAMKVRKPKAESLISSHLYPALTG